jgi:hypothetical protein
MPEKRTLERAKEDEEHGKRPTTQAGEFVREEMDHIREGKHGARSSKQAIAIGLSKARRAGVKLPPPEAGQASPATRKKAEQDYKKGQSKKAAKEPSRKRSQATTKALKREGTAAASHSSLSKQAKSVARKRSSTAKKSSSAKSSTTTSNRRQA